MQKFFYLTILYLSIGCPSSAENREESIDETSARQAAVLTGGPVGAELEQDRKRKDY